MDLTPARPPRPPDVVVVVDELDLTAVPPARREQVRDTFVRELVRLVSDDARPGARTPGLAGLVEGGGVDALDDLPRMRVGADANPVLVGTELARVVAACLVRSGRAPR